MSANFTSGVTVDAVAIRRGMPGSRSIAVSVAGLPGLIERRPLEAGAEPFRADLPRFEAHSEAGVLLDQIVAVVDRDDWCDAEVAAANGEIEIAAPSLIRVIQEFRLQRFEMKPSRRFAPAQLEDEPDMWLLAPSFDRRRDIVVGECLLQPGLQLFGFIRVEPSAGQRLQVVAQLLTDISFGDASDFDALDNVVSVDVGLACDDEDDSDFAVGIENGSNRRNESRLFGLNACGQEPKVFPQQRFADECGDVLLEAGTEPSEVEPRYLRRADCCPFGRFGDLSGGRQQRHDKKCGQQSESFHVGSGSNSWADT